MTQDNQTETAPEAQGTLFASAEPTHSPDEQTHHGPSGEAGEADPEQASRVWSGWPPQVWDGAKWVPIEPAKLLAEQDRELRRLRAARAVGVAFMVAGDRASLIPVNPIACERLRNLTPGTTVVVELAEV
jgi:hypothetical protein